MFEDLAVSVLAGRSTYDVFLSYSNRDDEIAVDLERRLQNNRISVWRDRTSILAGTRWNEEINNALGYCRVLVALITPAFCQSHWTPYEVQRVRGRTGIFTPIRVIPCLWEGSIPDYLADIQAIDFRSNRSEAFKRLVRELRHLLPSVDEGERAKAQFARAGFKLVQSHLAGRDWRSAAGEILGYANHQELGLALKKRGLRAGRSSEERRDELLSDVTSSSAAQALIADVFTVADLKAILRAEGQPVSGNKVALIGRLLDHFADAG